jgi:purine-binding chemotaxis protein CheW
MTTKGDSGSERGPSGRAGATPPEGRVQLLLAQVAEQSYGIPIAEVREIVRYVRLTRFSDVADAVAGALDLRGEILPVIDMRRRFGLGPTRIERNTPIVIVRADGSSMGLIFEAVTDVVELDASTLDPPHDVLATARRVVGVATIAGALTQVLDTGQLLSAIELEATRAALRGLADPDDTDPPADDLDEERQ